MLRCWKRTDREKSLQQSFSNAYLFLRSLLIGVQNKRGIHEKFLGDVMEIFLVVALIVLVGPVSLGLLEQFSKKKKLFRQ